ncbi:MAG: phosphoenolpyruvate--protein phosphotransferase [Marivirga sp.]|nr:phosphoenolpyruvate--protein phosphotransferase [Marivirga sp.]
MYGVVASPGISIGKAYVIKEKKIASTGILLRNDNEVIAEIEKFETAVQASVDDVQAIKKNDDLKLSHQEIEILETHIEFLADPQIKTDVYREITTNRRNVIDAVIEVIHKNVQVFKNMDNEYLRGRAADVQDIGDRILKNLSSADKEEIHFMPDTIIIAEDISPSYTITFDMSRIIGFATQVGGKTSHTAILAKSRNIPAVLGCGNVLSVIENNDVLIVDATKGIVIVNPDENTIAEYKVMKDAYAQKQNLLRSLKDTAAKTTDGIEIKLLANISDGDDLEESLEYGAEGAGLFRTELLFMNRNSFPLEEEQFEFYKKVALKSKGKPVIVRTIDIGGDKPLGYFKFPKEENPFLGYRGIRICLDRKDIFVTQLTAILRASVFGSFKIMFPMISNIHELRMAKEILESTKRELQQNNIDFDKTIQVGMMIEVPSAAITADILAREVDFFSIGTNDLCQYTLAVDRVNEQVKDLYDPFDPAVLRLIGYVIEQAHKRKISVGMCGELASDPRATLLLMGMGLKEFSMNAASIPPIKNVIINNSYSRAKEVYGKILAMDNSKSIIDYLQL